MTPEEYDHWYASGRGRWIGETEYRLLVSELDCQRGDAILDVGCGTGWFTRRLAGLPQAPLITGIDVDLEALAYARGQDAKSQYLHGDARSLPFADNSFDRIVSVTALCFVNEWPEVLKEIVRVTRNRFVIATLNRHSLLWRKKGRGSDQGAYEGAHWHTEQELAAAFSKLAVRNLHFRTCIWMPGGGLAARCVEQALPNRTPFGAFLLAVGDKS